MLVAPLLAPVRVTQTFGNYNQQLYRRPPHRHKGLDLRAALRQPVFFPEDGVVVHVWNGAGAFGYGVRTRDDNGSWNLAHFDERPRWEEGQHVRAGALAGYADSSGNSTGHHLHLGRRDSNGAPVNPLHVYARYHAVRAGVDPDVFHRQIAMESGWNPWAHSWADAQGIAQIIPRWHPNVDPWDPFDSLRYATNLMSSHLAWSNGDYPRALGAYNAGKGRIRPLGVWAPRATWPRETRNYVTWILKGVDLASTDEHAALVADSKRNHEKKMAALAQQATALGLTVRMRATLERSGVWETYKRAHPDDAQLYTDIHQWFADNVD